MRMQSAKKAPLLMILTLPLLSAAAARADWQGVLTIQDSAQTEKMNGKVFSKFPMLRFDVKANGQDASILTDLKKHKSSMLLHSRKMVMEMQPKDSPVGAIGECESGQI